jgi:hypothetical protein
LISWAEARLNQSVSALNPIRGGGNNRLYQLITRTGATYALKVRLHQAGDPRDRLGVETAALRFLCAQRVTSIPIVVAHDSEQGCALLEWMDGVPVSDPTTTDLDAALSFIAQLKTLARHPEAQALPMASECCLSGTEIVRQVRSRLERLKQVAPAHPELAMFLNEIFVPLLEERVLGVQTAFEQHDLDFSEEIVAVRRTLSPSDFGFHNMLRRADGTLVFLDFEYFGWDDPVKLTADFCLHPGMSLTEALKTRFIQGAVACFTDDPTFAFRLEVLTPLYGLRWGMILLNEFLPERWARRCFATGLHNGQMAQHHQLSKARRLLKRIQLERFHA